MKSPKKKSSLQPKTQEPLPAGTPRTIRNLFKIPNLSDLAGGDKKNKAKQNETPTEEQSPGAPARVVTAKEGDAETEDSPTRRKKKENNGEKAVKKRRKSVERKSEKPKRSSSVTPRVPRDSEARVKTSKPRKTRSVEPVLRSPDAKGDASGSAKLKKGSPKTGSSAKRKTPRRKSIGAPMEAEKLVSPTKTPRSSRSVTSMSTSLGSEGLDDLMANLDAADAEAATQELTSPSTPSRKPKLRTTVDDRGKIHRVSRAGMVRREGLAEDEDDDINSRCSNNSSLRQKIVAHDAERRARRRSLGGSADGERPTARERRPIEGRPQDSPKRLEGRSPRSPRASSDVPFRAGSVRSYHSDRARDDDDGSVHSSRSENYLRNRRLARKTGHMSLNDVTKEIDMGKRRIGPSSERSLKSDRSARSARSHHSNVSIDSVIEKYAGAVANDDSDVSRLERDLSKSEEKVRALIEEQRTGQAEAAKARTELMHFKLDFQKLEKKNRELQDEIKVVDDHLREKDRRIANLEKAVESQLDKVDELESELKNANDEIFNLEDKIKELELQLASLDEKDTEKAGEIKSQLDNKREQSLERRHRELDERAKRLSEEKEKLEELRNNQRIISDDGANKDKKLLVELKAEQAKAAERLKEKDSKIEELQGKVDSLLVGPEKSSNNRDSQHDSIVMKENEKLQDMLKLEQSKAASTIKKKDDTIAYMKMEMEKLKKELSERDLGNIGVLKKNIESLSSEAEAVKSQLEGAQRRNMLLEEEIDHWKSLNCNLEDDLDSWKSEAGEWKAKYQQIANEMDFDGNDGVNRPSSGRNLGTVNSFDNPAAAKYMIRGSHQGEDLRLVNSERGARSISNIWNALVSPTQANAGK